METLAGVKDKEGNCTKAIQAYREALKVFKGDALLQPRDLVVRNISALQQFSESASSPGKTGSIIGYPDHVGAVAEESGTMSLLLLGELGRKFPSSPPGRTSSKVVHSGNSRGRPSN